MRHVAIHRSHLGRSHLGIAQALNPIDAFSSAAEVASRPDWIFARDPNGQRIFAAMRLGRPGFLSAEYRQIGVEPATWTPPDNYTEVDFRSFLNLLDAPKWHRTYAGLGVASAAALVTLLLLRV